MNLEERVAQGKQTRSMFVRAAAQRFARHGYDATSLSDIAAVFGKPKTALRYHFASKAQLASAISEYQYDAWARMIESARAAGLEGLVAFFSVLGAAILDGRREPYAKAIIQFRNARPIEPQSMPPRPFEWQKIAVEFVGDAVRLGELPASSDPVAVSKLLVDATFGVHQLGEADARENDELPEYRELWRRLLKGIDATDPEGTLSRVRVDLATRPREE
ncbi:hypothetical protein BH11ACT2_BH11ACT2_09770 [soil metagenome]